MITLLLVICFVIGFAALLKVLAIAAYMMTRMILVGLFFVLLFALFIEPVFFMFAFLVAFLFMRNWEIKRRVPY